MNAVGRHGTCEQPRLGALVGRYELGVASGEERRDLEAHLLDCDVCFMQLERGAVPSALLVQHANELLRAVRAPEPGHRLVGGAAWRRRLALLPRVWIAAPIAVAALVVASVVQSRLSDPARLATFRREAPQSGLLRGGPMHDDVRQLLESGAAHFDLGHYDEATKRFRAALERDPQHAEAAYWAGLSAALAGDPSAAIRDLELARRLASGDLAATSAWALANAFLKAGEIAPALAVLESLQAEDSEFREPSRQLLLKLRHSKHARGPGAWLRRLVPDAGAESRDSVTTASSNTGSLDAARRLFESEQLQACREQASRAVQSAFQSQDVPNEIDARQLLGDCLFELGLMQQAQAEYAAAGQAALQVADDRRHAYALEGEARVRATRGDLHETQALFVEVCTRARRLGDAELECRGLLGLGISQNVRGDDKSAIATFQKALGIARTQALHALETRVLQDLSLALFRSGDFETAIRMQEQALARARAFGRKRDVVTSLVRAGNLYNNVEQYSRTLALLHEAVPLAEQLEHRRALLNIRSQEATIYENLGRPEEALRKYESALALAREMRHTRAEAALLRRMGSVCKDLQRFDQAAQLYAEALELTAKLGNSLDSGDLQHLFGELHLARGEPDAAVKALERAVSGLDAVKHQSVSHWHSVLAQAYARNNNHTGARQLYARVIEKARQYHQDEVLREALLHRALLARQEGDLETADRDLAEAIELAEALRVALSGTEHRAGFLEQNARLYMARVGVLHQIAQGQRSGAAVLAAFQTAEQGKARALLDHMRGLRVELGVTVDPSLHQQENALLRQLRGLQTNLAMAEAESERDEPAIDSLRVEHVDASRAFREVQQEIAVLSPSYGQIFGVRGALGVEDVRRYAMDPDQTLLEYVVGEEESFVFLVDADQFQMERVDVGGGDLAQHVRALREALLAEDDAAMRHESQMLHGWLVAPIASRLVPNRRLLIIPDGPLFLLPFAVLHNGMEFLIESHTLSYAPSASVLDRRLHRPGSKTGRSLLAVGNPATFRQDELLAAVRAVQGWGFGELPYAEEEVRRIARHFRHKRVLTAGRATEEAVKRGIAAATHIHFATHGLVDAAEPLMSGLILAQDEDPLEDGFFQVHEILGLALQADLVVLSACNTGLGRVVRGEGVIGLTRAFLHAGARQVLISLWEVPDRSTVALMASFYTAHFGGKQSADRALQQSQQAFVAAGAAPRHWAAFVLCGRKVS